MIKGLRKIHNKKFYKNDRAEGLPVESKEFEGIARYIVFEDSMAITTKNNGVLTGNMHQLTAKVMARIVNGLIVQEIIRKQWKNYGTPPSRKKTSVNSAGMRIHGCSFMSLRGALMKRKKLSKAERIEIHSKTDGHCAYCGIEIGIADMQVDHVFPINRGGLDEKENMLPACRSCNHYKSTYDLEDFREEIGKWHERLMRDSVTYKNAVRFGVVTPTPRKIEFYFERCENAN